MLGGWRVYRHQTAFPGSPSSAMYMQNGTLTPAYSEITCWSIRRTVSTLCVRWILSDGCRCSSPVHPIKWKPLTLDFKENLIPTAGVSILDMRVAATPLSWQATDSVRLCRLPTQLPVRARQFLFRRHKSHLQFARIKQAYKSLLKGFHCQASCGLISWPCRAAYRNLAACAEVLETNRRAFRASFLS